MMAAGDKEIVLASEEATRRNVQACIDFSNETRRIVKAQEEKIDNLQAIIRTRDEDIAQLRLQLSTIQAKVFAGGTE
jgi:hypothetical protein